MSLVNGYRVKCASMRSLREAEQNNRARGESWDRWPLLLSGDHSILVIVCSWVRERESRLARLGELQNRTSRRASRGEGRQDPTPALVPALASNKTSMKISVIEGSHKDGYCRLEVREHCRSRLTYCCSLQDVPSTFGSLTDFGEFQDKDSNCFKCSIQ